MAAFARAACVVAILAIAICGCAQRSPGALPMVAALARSASEPAAKSGTLSHRFSVDFPSPVNFDDAGDAPSVSMITPTKIVEENAKNGSLIYRVGDVAADNVNWRAGVLSGGGFRPALATYGNEVVDVHVDGDNNLLYRVGSLSGNSIAWGQSQSFETGAFGRVAFSGADTILEVHDGANGQVYYTVGSLNAAKKKIAFGKSTSYDNGYAPSVAANTAGTAIEVHGGGVAYGTSHLYYTIGKIDATSKKVTWDTSQEVPGTTTSPSSVAWSPQGYIVVSYVCTAPYPFNLYYLCTMMGTLNSDNKTISWYGAQRSYLLNGYPRKLSVTLNGDTAVAAVGFDVIYNSTSIQYAVSLLSDRANWEGDRLDSSLKGKTLHQIVFPASHDAGMYKDVSGGTGTEALAQDQDLYGQLTGGQRYFDLRPDYNLRFNHGPVDGPRVQTGLNDVAKFMSEGHREVVILKFSHFDFGSDATLYPKLLKMIKTTLATWLYTNSTGKRLADIPLTDLLKSGHGVVLPVVDIGYPTNVDGIYTYRDWENQHGPQTGQITAFDQYTDSEIYSTMSQDQLNKFAAFKGTMKYAPGTPCDFFLLSWTLTPVSLVYSVAPVANAHLGSVMSGVARNKYGQIPNILYVDFYEWSGAADVAIGMNGRF